jgi:hypothetical protein
VVWPPILLFEQQKKSNSLRVYYKGDKLWDARRNLLANELPQNSRSTLAAIHSQCESVFFFYEFPFSGMGTVESLSPCCFNMGDCRSELTKAD